ncbi:MAG: MmgE/PrpD family protein [Pseudomonadota bacterium]
MQKTIAEKISEFCFSLDYDAIPANVLEKAKDLILDTVGICLRSSKIDFGGIILNLAQSWGGASESSLVGSNVKVCMHHAAFANGVLGHGLDYDDTHTESVVHPSSCLVPVALSVGEKTGRSGEDVLAALIAGLEVMIRIGMPALNRFHMRGFHTTSICGTFASAVVAGKLMDLSQTEMNNALGISGSFTSGLLECLSFGSWAKQLHAGWAGMGGIVSAQLAQRSYTGPASIFEGRLGLYNSFLRSEQLDLNLIFNGIGEEWEVLNIRPKLYPCCHYLQAFLDCAAFLRKKHGFDTRKIQKIICRVSEGAANIICTPWDKKLAPTSAYDLKFSLPYAVSIMFIKGKAGFSEFSTIPSQDAEVSGLMDKVTYEIEPAFKVKDMPGAIRVLLSDGTSLEHCIDQVRGDAGHPISREELLEKFYDNCLPVLGKEMTGKIADQVFNFEQQGDIRGFMGQLAGMISER